MLKAWVFLDALRLGILRCPTPGYSYMPYDWVFLHALRLGILKMLYEWVFLRCPTTGYSYMPYIWGFLIILNFRQQMSGKCQARHKQRSCAYPLQRPRDRQERRGGLQRLEQLRGGELAGKVSGGRWKEGKERGEDNYATWAIGYNYL